MLSSSTSFNLKYVKGHSGVCALTCKSATFTTKKPSGSGRSVAWSSTLINKPSRLFDRRHLSLVDKLHYEHNTTSALTTQLEGNDLQVFVKF